jgi:D-3-phosphoglycerate dehydrogenase
MKVLVADKFEKSGLTGLAELGGEVVYQPDLKDDPLTEAIRSSGAEVLIVRSTKVTRAMLEAGKLSLVVRAGAGYNTIDVEAASERGIYVANCPGKNSVAVAELAFGLILALDRQIPDNAADLKRGVWNRRSTARLAGSSARRSA